MRALLLLLALLAVNVGGAGCAGPSGPRIPGIARFEVESFRVLLTHDEDSSRELRVGGTSVEEVDLRIGDSFEISGDPLQHDAYQLLLIDPPGALLRWTRTVDQRLQRGTIVRDQTVIRIDAYSSDSEPVEAAPATAESRPSETDSEAPPPADVNPPPAEPEPPVESHEPS